MNNLYSLTMVVLTGIILQVQSIAAPVVNEFDMNMYASWAGFVFLFVILLGFMLFLYFTSAENEQRELLKSKKTVHISVSPLKLTGEISASLNLVFYLLISLILLNITLLVLFVT